VTVTATYPLVVSSHPTREEMGQHAGRRAAVALRRALADRGEARMMLAAAPSQEATLQALAAEEGIDWSRVTCFHMDDYIGLPQDAPQGFGNWLRHHFFSRVPEATFHSIDTTRAAEEEAARYAGLMGEEPFDVVLLGLGVNGHLAFNDPPADLEDPDAAKVITLDRVSRQQQVDEGLFDRFDDVPEQAITVTIPRLLNAVEIVGSVSGKAKRNAVADTLNQPVSGEHPGTALRTHPNVALYLDAEADPR
jgi:glucosamine-6-phosphate deaminase